MKNYAFLFTLLIFYCYLYFSLISTNVLITDDVARGSAAFYRDTFELNYSDFLWEYLNTANMTSRPVSSIIYISICYLIQIHKDFYYLNYLFFPLSLVTIFLTARKLFSESYSSILMLLYALIPLGSAVVYSPIMMNSNIATIFYCLSLFYVLTPRKNYIISLFFLILSILSYEIFAPLLFFNVMLINSGWKNRVLYLFAALTTLLIYKKIIEPYFFSNYISRERLGNIFQLDRNIFLVYLFVKSLTLDFLKALYKSFVAIKYYSLYDSIFLISFLATNFYLIARSKFEIISYFGKLRRYTILALILTFLIFAFSSYEPTIYAFSNRTLGAVRLFFSLLLLLVFFLITSKNGFKERKFKVYVMLLLGFLSVSSLSIKNAWKYADLYNKQLFSKLSDKLNQNLKSNYIYIIPSRDEELRKDFYILNEPFFLEIWEEKYLKKQFKIADKIVIKYYNPDELPAEYLLYDYKTDKLTLVQNH